MTEMVIKELGLRPSEVAYCTFTGKASLVLSKYHNGKSQVSTIHKLIYEVREDAFGEPIFVLKDGLPDLRLIVVDEASMVNGKILKDLMSFNKPILAIGDHGQLPPIGEETNLMSNPDFKLTEILRQAADNPIIYLSMLAREGKKLEPGTYDNKVIVMKKDDKRANPGVMLKMDQVICGYNRTRSSLNNAMRKKLGYTSENPAKDDKVIFLRNNWNSELEGYNIVNGMIGNITNDPSENKLDSGLKIWDVDVKPDFLKSSFANVKVPQTDFLANKEKLNKFDAMKVDRIDYGYAITAHKSQGSQFERVFVWNEPLGEEKWRWTYTAITRAKGKLIIAL
ncbi:ATP-binding protein [Oceanobacillus kimchii]|uniref:ATP-binding protein n=2 Tax=Oceanobacillus kimchii TaxID=746691 RepID=A0ABQ5TKT0_9BACI|nr:ATP-binding protein [Oceanobacillus kimchii]